MAVKTPKVIYRESDRCRKCLKFVTNNQNGVCCDFCNHWFHLKCSSLTKKSLDLLGESDETWMCTFCAHETFPFYSLDKDKFSRMFENFATKSCSS